jgi:hypothetical protein
MYRRAEPILDEQESSYGGANSTTAEPTTQVSSLSVPDGAIWIESWSPALNIALCVVSWQVPMKGALAPTSELTGHVTEVATAAEEPLGVFSTVKIH